ncbi:2-oxoacid:acceptor oxidoreductase subunit alpha [Methanoregula sp.]|uniref:2-oxoacid:acceptor oxidoreductase subunit alpha n=1 Tax=Methanoregula sp. TaxID=2052170 RepID=UPI002B84DFA7|nr:2-oxoacid:acceptor oxidoreductase subunit alpha [Methanoregula sp.]HVP97098.1 2-oxoacid:acceptor oxidoreductase subunit alpha [Methanoregula sp.]
MKDLSVLVGGRAGDGISNAGMMVAQLFNHLGYFVYMYTDYPSLIRGGHNFALIRAADEPVGAYNNHIDYLIALNQETVTQHLPQCTDCTVVANADLVKSLQKGQTLSVNAILKEESAPPITGNSAMIGAFAKSAGIPWEVVGEVFRRHLPKAADENIRVAKRAYDEVQSVRSVPPIPGTAHSLLTGNEAIGLGLAAGGLDAYIAYPMTPSSTLLHFLAGNAERLGIRVIHPENEIAVMLMGLGSAVAGAKTAVGTSGGGFCLMTEGLSFAGMAEIPIVIVVSQRTGPSTGLPTYTGQADLRFVLHAGQGEFPRLVVAPADAGEAYLWSTAILHLSWRYQIPGFVLTDKTLSEGTYSVDNNQLRELPSAAPVLWDGEGTYRRYLNTADGISPLAFPSRKDSIVKVNSYAHDEDGITTEDAGFVTGMAEKRKRKETHLREDLKRYPCVNVRGSPGAATALLCWGSVRNACDEVAGQLGLRVIQPVVLSPFPKEQFSDACRGIDRLIAVEENATGQLAALVHEQGVTTQATLLRYDGRPFTPAELLVKVQEVLTS